MGRTRRQREERRKVSARKVAENKKSGLNLSTLKVPDGVTLFQIDKVCTKRLDILDYVTGSVNSSADEPGMLHYEMPYLQHRGIGSDEKAAYVCPRTIKKSCPICEHRAQLIKEGADWKDDVVKALKAKERQLFLLYDLDDLEKGLQIWDYSYYNFGKMLNDRIKASDEEDGYEFFSSHGEDGMTLRIAFDEETFGTNKYLKASSIDFKARRKQYDSDLIDSFPCLDDLLVVESYEKLKRVLIEDADDEDDDEDEPVEPKAAEKKRKPPVQEVEEEDDDEPAKPAAKQSSNGRKSTSKAKASIADDDDEADDEWADDDEDEVDDECLACEGTGKNTRGGKCRPCKGTGKIALSDEDDEEDKPLEKKKPVASKKGQAPKSSQKDKTRVKDEEEDEDDEGNEEQDDDDDEWANWEE